MLSTDDDCDEMIFKLELYSYLFLWPEKPQVKWIREISLMDFFDCLFCAELCKDFSLVS